MNTKNEHSINSFGETEEQQHWKFIYTSNRGPPGLFLSIAPDCGNISTDFSSQPSALVFEIPEMRTVLPLSGWTFGEWATCLALGRTPCLSCVHRKNHWTFLQAIPDRLSTCTHCSSHYTAEEALMHISAAQLMAICNAQTHPGHTLADCSSLHLLTIQPSWCSCNKIYIHTNTTCAINTYSCSSNCLFAPDSIFLTWQFIKRKKSACLIELVRHYLAHFVKLAELCYYCQRWEESKRSNNFSL